MTNIEPQIPSPLPPLPPVDEDLRAQIYTHASSTSTQNPTPYDRLALLGGATLQAAITRILFNHPSVLDRCRISELRSFYVSTPNVSFWACAYGFDDSIVASNLPPTPGSLNNIAAASFQAYLGAVVLKTSQEVVTTFIEELAAPSLTKVRVDVTVDKYAVQYLNEKLKRLTIPLPEWVSERDEMEEVERRFEVSCFIKGRLAGKAKARSIPEGKRKAASHAMNKPEKFFTALIDNKRG